MLPSKERKEFKEYLEIHWMSEGKSLGEVVTGVIAQAFLRTEKHEIGSHSSGTLPTMRGRWVSTTLVVPGPSLKP